VQEYARTWNDPVGETKAQAICDFEGNHFQLMNAGWRKGDYNCYILFHFDIKNGKVWVQENRTDILIGQELVEKGIPKSDIVLGLQPPEVRAELGYAVA
jgi:hypothetical protein